MTTPELEQTLLQLSPREKLRIIQLLLQSISALWNSALPVPQAEPQTQNPSPVSILNRLAAANACSTIEAPLQWQQEQRQDRTMPERER